MVMASPPAVGRRTFGLRGVGGLLVAATVLSGCKATYSERVGEFRAAFRSGDFAHAENLVDQHLADETDLDLTYVSKAAALAAAPELANDDAWLLGLEKGMTVLARGDVDGARALFERGRAELEHHVEATAVDWIESVILDDTYMAYRGYDHELVMLRTMIALCALLQGRDDAARDVEELVRFEQALAEGAFGASSGYDYRMLIPRVALGSYLAANLHESAGRAVDAFRMYRDLRDAGADLDLIVAAMKRTERGGAPPSTTHGVVHIFTLVGSSPTLIEAVHPPTEFARSLAGVAVALYAEAGSAAMAVPIKVPQVFVNDEFVASLTVDVPGFQSVETEALVDFNHIFITELEAFMPWILARAMARRSLKAAAVAVVETQVRDAIGGDQGDLAGFVAGATLSLGATAVEDADTRSWSSLPAQVQVARLALPAGVHDIAVGPLARAHVKVTPGRDSYMLIIAPEPMSPGAAIVDAYSRVSN
jgi:uncharacterized protein